MLKQKNRKNHNKASYDTLYDDARNGKPLTKQALLLIGNALEEEEEKTEEEEKEEYLQNPKIKYAKDKNGLVHDKECYKVKKYRMSTLTWMADAGVNVVFCKDCYRKALLRRSMDKNCKGKDLDACLAFFDKYGLSNYYLNDLCMIRGAKVRLISENVLWIKEREDEWKIEYDYANENFILWHNSYVTQDKKRYITGDYHVQSINVKARETLAGVLHNIVTYSNKFHVGAKEEQPQTIKEKSYLSTKKTVPDDKGTDDKEDKKENASGFSYFDRIIANRTMGWQ